MRVLSQIAHNIIQGTIPLTSTDQERLKRQRRFLHLLGDRKLGYKHKHRLVRNKHTLLLLLVNIAVTYLKQVLQ